MPKKRTHQKLSPFKLQESGTPKNAGYPSPSSDGVESLIGRPFQGQYHSRSISDVLMMHGQAFGMSQIQYMSG